MDKFSIVNRKFVHIKFQQNLLLLFIVKINSDLFNINIKSPSVSARLLYIEVFLSYKKHILSSCFLLTKSSKHLLSKRINNREQQLISQFIYHSENHQTLLLFRFNHLRCHSLLSTFSSRGSHFPPFRLIFPYTKDFNHVD